MTETKLCIAQADARAQRKKNQELARLTLIFLTLIFLNLTLHFMILTFLPAMKEAVDAALSSRGHVSPARKKQKRGNAGSDASNTVAMRAQLDNLTRQAMHAMRPCTEDGKHYHRMVCWDTTNPAACCKMLLLRHQGDLKEDFANEGGIDAMAEKHEKVKKIANNERSIQSQTLRKIFLFHKNLETQLVNDR